jgi:AraC family transcriptional regulator
MSTCLQQAVDRITYATMPGGLCLRETCYRPGGRQGRHRHAESIISLVLAGEVVEETATMSYRAAAGSLLFKPAGQWHANYFGPRGTRIVQILSSDDGGRWQHDVREYRWVDAPRVARSVIALLSRKPSAAEAAELELWDALGMTGPAGHDASPSHPPRWWRDALDLLDACTTQSISVAAVARRVGVHPVYLARVCRRRLGCTVRQYIRHRRVLAAWRASQREEASLAAIALRVGFADQAHMTRAFTTVLGTSPGQLRRIAAAG